MSGGGSGRVGGRVCVVTGGASGIGGATARMLAREGGRVTVLDVRDEDGARTAEATGGYYAHTDVTDERAVAAAFAGVREREGRLDVLVTCAGGSVPQDGPIAEVDLGVFDRTFRLDVLGTMHAVRHAVPLMQESGGGSIVTFSSSAAVMGYVPWHIYSSAKGAVIGLTQAVAGYYAKAGIRANAVAPGIVRTDRVRDRQDNGNWAMKLVTERYADHPFGIGEVDDIASIVLFLASDESRMLTGEVMSATGGLSAY